MYTWEYLKNNISKNNIILSRLADIQQKYIVNKNNILKKYVTYEDFIKIKYLKFKAYQINMKIVAIKHKDSLGLNFVLNKYPYNIQKNIKHYILFSIKPLSITEQNIIINNLIPQYKFLNIVNNISDRSIKNLWHCHVFVKIS